jgi:hypothetical protein
MNSVLILSSVSTLLYYLLVAAVSKIAEFLLISNALMRVKKSKRKSYGQKNLIKRRKNEKTSNFD